MLSSQTRAGTSATLATALTVAALVALPTAPASAVSASALTWHDTATRNLGDGYAATRAVVAAEQPVQMPDGGVVFYDRNTHNLRRVDSATKVITTIAGIGTGANCYDGGGSLATDVSVPEPAALAADSAGDLFLEQPLYYQWGQCNSAPVLRLDHVDKQWHVVVSNLVNGAGGANLGRYDAMAVSGNGTVYVSDPLRHVVRAFAPGSDPGGPGVVVAGTDGVAGGAGDGGQATVATIENPSLATASGVLVLADGLGTTKTMVRRIDLATGVITHVAGTGALPTASVAPDPAVGQPAAGAALGVDGLTIGSDGTTIYVHQNRVSGADIESFEPGGVVTSVAASVPTAACTQPFGIAVATLQATSVVLARCGGALRSWAADGSNPTSHGSIVAGLDTIDSDGTSPDGSVLADEFPGQIDDLAVSPTGAVAMASGGGVRRVASLTPNAPVSILTKSHGLAVTFGSDGTLYSAILDGTSSHVTATTSAGVTTTVAGGGAFSLMDGASATTVTLPVTDDVAVDSSAGVLYLLACSGQPDPTYLDRPYRQIWAVTLATGAIHLYSGNGLDGVIVEGQSASQTPVGRALSIAVDPTNHSLYVATPSGVGRITPDRIAHGPVALYDHLPGLTVGSDGTLYGQTVAIASDGTSTQGQDTSPATAYTTMLDGSFLAARPGVPGSLLQTSDVLTPATVADVAPLELSVTAGPGTLTVSVTPPAVAGQPVNVQLQDLAAPQSYIYLFGFGSDGATTPHTVTIRRAGPVGDNYAGALDPTHTYRAIASTGDSTGRLGMLRVVVASPLADTTPPAPATGLTATQSLTSVPTVHLTLPVDPDLATVEACMTTGPAPVATDRDCGMGPDVVPVTYPLTGPTMSVAIYRQGPNDPTVDRTFTVFVTDVAGNVSAASSVTIPAGTLSATDPGSVPDINWQSSPAGSDARFSFRGDPTGAAIVEGATSPAPSGLGTGVDSGRTWYAANLIAGHTYTVAFFRWNTALTHVTRTTATFVAGTSSHDVASVIAPPSVAYAARASVSTVVARAVTGSTATSRSAGVPVELWTRPAPSTTWVLAATGTTDANGAASWPRPALAATTSYQVRVPAQGYTFPAVIASPVTTTVVHSTITASLASTSALSARSVRVKTKTVLYVHVAPRQVRTVQVQRYTSGAWRTILTTRTTSTGYVGYTYIPTARGTVSLRVVCLATSATAASISRTMVVKAT